MNVQIDDIQGDLRGYLRRLEAGETLTLCEGDRPVAVIKPLPEESAARDLRPFGLYTGRIHVPDDFDDPLPEEILRLYEGEWNPARYPRLSLTCNR